MDVPDNTSADEAVLQGDEMGILLRVLNGNTGEFDVEILIDRLELSGDGDVVFEFDCDGGFLFHEFLEQLEKQHATAFNLNQGKV